MARHEEIPGGVHTELAEALGTPLTGAVEELVSRMPTPAETELLHLPPGTPVVELTRVIHAGERPVEVTLWLFDASRHRFVYEVPID
ncbi:UTRA domain-containing protein [Thermocatellispora tengchongensis]|uniref:UTRA domain-containing protein n=1 Tax=Thermocatellispora tengchongensis TaxID=1073253 RepID=UPI0028A715CA|nr:UTRA domain-containing protein [Thermocatellispora tengchongensis]